MSAGRLDWAAAHLGLKGDDVESLRAILAKAWNDGWTERAMTGALTLPERRAKNPYEPTDDAKGPTT